jgi:hypothetical protein
MPNIDWTWLIVGILLGVFVVPFVTARLGGRKGAISRNQA